MCQNRCEKGADDQDNSIQAKSHAGRTPRKKRYKVDCYVRRDCSIGGAIGEVQNSPNRISSYSGRDIPQKGRLKVLLL